MAEDIVTDEMLADWREQFNRDDRMTSVIWEYCPDEFLTLRRCYTLHTQQVR